MERKFSQGRIRMIHIDLKLTLALMYIGKLNKIDAKTIPNDINNALLALKWGLSGCIIQRNLSTAEKYKHYYISYYML